MRRAGALLAVVTGLLSIHVPAARAAPDEANRTPPFDGGCLTTDWTGVVTRCRVPATRARSGRLRAAQYVKPCLTYSLLTPVYPCLDQASDIAYITTDVARPASFAGWVTAHRADRVSARDNNVSALSVCVQTQEWDWAVGRAAAVEERCAQLPRGRRVTVWTPAVHIEPPLPAQLRVVVFVRGTGIVHVTRMGYRSAP